MAGREAAPFRLHRRAEDRRHGLPGRNPLQWE